MFTSMDKALVALVMGALYVWNALAPWQIGVDEQTVQTVIGILTPILVYLIPNKQKVSE